MRNRKVPALLLAVMLLLTGCAPKDAGLAVLTGLDKKELAQGELPCRSYYEGETLMLPLCGILEITVNDLLTGERVSQLEYQKKAEENMMDLMKENEENKRRMVLSVVCGLITIIAVCALIVIAAYVQLPTAARIALIVFAAATAVAGIWAAVVLDARAGYFECPYCKALFVPTMSEYVKGYHTFTRRRLTCHQCGKTGMCRHRVVRS